MKKDKLYTVNKWNKNLFYNGGPYDAVSPKFQSVSPDINWDYIRGNADAMAKWNTIKNTPVENLNTGSNFNLGNVASGIASVAPREAFDYLDPVWHLAGGRESKLGNAFSDAGVDLFKAGAQSGNAGLMIAGAAAKIGGGLINLGWGVKENKENVNAIKNNTALAKTAGNLLSGASDSTSFFNAAGKMTGSMRLTAKDLYKNGLFTSKGTKKGNALVNKENSALAYQTRGAILGANNADSNLDDTAFVHTVAYGGPLDSLVYNGVGPAEYSMFQDYMRVKDKQAANYSKLSGISPMANTFKEGGKIHIKKSHRGRLTELKKRTGKTEAELYNDGNPAHKKMVVFARNARKWKKAYGGLLDATENLFAEGGPKGDKWVTPVGIVSAGGFVPNNTRGSYGGGRGSGGGAGTKDWSLPEYVTTEKNDTVWVPIERNFNDAFREAARKGLTEFKFNGTTYPVEYGDNPNWESAGNSRIETIGMVPITTKRKTTERKKAEGGPINVLCGGGKMFALGGDAQMHGADYSTGLSHIEAGGTHEENENEGVQVGVDSQGIPNLVEENETIFNDYVYSARIQLDEEAKEAFHIGKKRDITYADMSKKLEKEASERPNDPISAAALKLQMEDLAQHQERQKAEMQAEEARQAFEALSPEEQVAVMQEMQAQEQAAQEAAVQEQAMAEQQAMQGQQVPPEMMQGAPAEAMPQEQALPQDANMQMGQEPVVAAFGGKVNKFAGPQPGSNRMNNDTLIAKILNDKNLTQEQKEELILGLTTDSLEDRYNKRHAARAALQQYINNTNNNKDNQETATEVNNTPSANVVENTTEVKEADSKPNAQQKNTNPVRPAITRGATGLNLYGYYTNGSDGYSTPTGFKVGNNGKAYDYTDEYKDLVSKLGADDIRRWAAEHPDDISLKSFIARGNNLDKLTDDQWRKGATDGKYGFMHHVADSILNGDTDPTNTNIDPVMMGQRLAGMQANPTVTAPTMRAVGMSRIGQTDPVEVKTITDANGNKVVLTTTPVPEEGTTTGSTEGNVNPEKTITPNHRAEWPRYAGLFGPAVGLGLWAAGVGKPDFSDLGRALSSYTNLGAYVPKYTGIGNYLAYNPMDYWQEQNRLAHNARATDRAILNSASPGRDAALLANAYNNQIAAGNLYRQGLEYNDAKKAQVGEFNRRTDEFNAQAFNQNEQAKANILNADRQYRAQLAANIAAQKMDANAAWYNGLYGNISNLFQGISDLGRENAEHNTVADMAADSLFGVITKNQNIGRGYVSSKGGKLKKKKRGLTF